MLSGEAAPELETPKVRMCLVSGTSRPVRVKASGRDSRNQGDKPDCTSSTLLSPRIGSRHYGVSGISHSKVFKTMPAEDSPQWGHNCDHRPSAAMLTWAQVFCQALCARYLSPGAGVIPHPTTKEPGGT